MMLRPVSSLCIQHQIPQMLTKGREKYLNLIISNNLWCIFA